MNVQSRLANLQRKQELTARQRELDSVSLKTKAENRQQLLATKDNTDASKAAGQAKHTSSTKVINWTGLKMLCQIFGPKH